MISVNSLKELVETMTRNVQTGYLNGDDFNRLLALIQTDIFEYYRSRFDENEQIFDALRPFIAEKNIVQHDGVYSLPANFERKLDIGVQYVTASQCGGEPTVNYIPVDYLTGDEALLGVNSPVRVNLAKKRFAAELFSSYIKIYPREFTGKLYLKYLRTPVTPVWGYEINLTTLLEEYDESSTTDLEWNTTEIGDFTDLFLYYMGLQTRETALINFVNAKKTLNAS